MKRKIKLTRKPGRGWTGDFGKAGLGHWAECDMILAKECGFPVLSCTIVSSKDWRRICKLLEVKS